MLNKPSFFRNSSKFFWVKTPFTYNSTPQSLFIAKDQNNKIPVASNCVQIDASKNYKTQFNITLRNGFLFDLENKTDVFTNTPVVDQILVQHFEHIPEYARKLIVIKAGTRSNS